MKPMAFFDLPRECFPFVIEAFHPQTREVVWTRKVNLPEPETEPVKIPPLAKRLGHRVGIRLIFPDGSIREY